MHTRASHEIQCALSAEAAGRTRTQYFPAVGDWRQAAQNVSYQDEVDYHLRTTGAVQH